MATATSIFQWEVEGDTLILTPLTDLHETEYQQLEEERRNIVRFFKRAPTKNVVMDFSETDYSGSTALCLFLQVWKEVRKRNGRMAFCNVTSQEMEILKVTWLEHFWSICSSREEAIAAVRMAPSEYQVQKAGKGQIWTTICRGPEAKAREVFQRQLRLYSIGRFRLLDANGQVIDERKSTSCFSDN
jgi:anti-anti-sigma factor